jgi:hypothetical protein
MTIGEDLRVQALVEQGIQEVPKQFLCKVDEPQIEDNPDQQVPVIDLAGTIPIDNSGQKMVMK